MAIINRWLKTVIMLSYGCGIKLSKSVTRRSLMTIRRNDITCDMENKGQTVTKDNDGSIAIETKGSLMVVTARLGKL
jgi:hypothetical protein